MDVAAPQVDVQEKPFVSADEQSGGLREETHGYSDIWSIDVWQELILVSLAPQMAGWKSIPSMCQ